MRATSGAIDGVDATGSVARCGGRARRRGTGASAVGASAAGTSGATEGSSAITRARVRERALDELVGLDELAAAGRAGRAI